MGSWVTEGNLLDVLVFNLATDDDDPILGFTTGWINALARYCASIDVVTMRAGHREVAGNVRVFSVGKEKGYTELHRAFEFYRILLGLLRSKHYDACFCHMIPLFAVMAAPLLKPRRVRLILWYAHKAVPLTLRAAERVVDAVVTPTRESFPLPSRKLELVGHGIDTDLFTARPASPTVERPFTITCVGRKSPIKHLEVIIQAVRLLVCRDGITDLRVRMIGPTAPKDSAYARMLHDLVAESDLKEEVVFVDPVPYRAIAHEYRQADLLVSTSQTGSADKVVLEAMACEVPVLTSNAGFASVLSPWSEVLLARGNDPETLAVMMKRLIEMQPSERIRIGRALRRLVEDRHSLNRLARKLVSEVF